MGQNVSTGMGKIYGRSDYCFVPSFEGSRCCGFSFDAIMREVSVLWLFAL